MQYNNYNIKPQIREKKNALKQLRNALEQQDKIPTSKDLKSKRGSLELFIRNIKIQRLKNEFYNKLMLNNEERQIFEVQFQSETQINKKRLIKWKGFKPHPYLVSMLYLFELVFLIITFFISSFIAFLPDFIQNNVHQSPVVVIIGAITIVLSFIKIFITSTTQTIKKGIMLKYVSDIFITYAKSFLLFVDMVYLSILVILFILSIFLSKQGKQHDHVQNPGLALFIWSIIRISISNENLTYFRTSFLDTFKKQQYYKLFNVVLFNFIFAHFIASMLLAMSQIDANDNWMISAQINHEIWYVQYMWSIYWATTIMMTVGFGDFLPVTYKEGIIVSLIEFFSCIVLAYNISQIGGIVSRIRASQDEYIGKLEVFQRMVHQNQVNSQLQIKIQDFLREQKAIKERFEFNRQTQLLDSLPESLRKQFIMASYGKIFTFLPFFNALHKKSVMQLTQHLKSKIYYPGQTITKSNQEIKLISILKEGKAGMSYRKMNSNMNGIIVEQIEVEKRECLDEDGKFVNIMCPILLNTQFLSPGKVLNYDIIAVGYSYALQLDHVDLMATIKDSEIDTEYYFKIAHSTLMKKSGWEQFRCKYCEIGFKEQFQKLINKQASLQDKVPHQYHTKFQCPRLHYVPIKTIIIMKYNKSPSKFQFDFLKYERKRQKTKSCLLLRKQVYSAYETKSFIKDKKNFQKFVKKATSFQFMSASLRSRKSIQETQSVSGRNKQSQPSSLQRRQMQLNENNLDINQKDQFLPDHRLKSNIEQDDVNDPMAEQVFTFAMDELYLNRKKLGFWSLQIDVMWNYMTYFPQCNAVPQDTMELVKGQMSRNRAFRLIANFMDLKNRVKKSEKIKQSIFNFGFEPMGIKTIEQKGSGSLRIIIPPEQIDYNEESLMYEEIDISMISSKKALNNSKAELVNSRYT